MFLDFLRTNQSNEVRHAGGHTHSRHELERGEWLFGRLCSVEGVCEFPKWIRASTGRRVDPLEVGAAA